MREDKKQRLGHRDLLVGNAYTMRMRYCVQWKDLDNPSKGTLWTYMLAEIKDFAKVLALKKVCIASCLDIVPTCA